MGAGHIANFAHRKPLVLLWADFLSAYVLPEFDDALHVPNTPDCTPGSADDFLAVGYEHY